MRCLVTGGSRGIGLAVAQKLAQSGYSVTLSATNRELLETRKSELPVVKEFQSHDTWQLDFTDLAAVASGAGAPRPLTEYTSYVNCAGIAGSALLLIQSPKSIEETLKVNLHAPILMAKSVSKAMLRSKVKEKRHILFMSSVLASRGVAGSAVYSASKAAIEGFSRSLAREMGSRGIAVNCLAPGLVETDMGLAASSDMLKGNVFSGLVHPKDVAEYVHFVLNSQSITGSVLTIDNGFSI